MSTTAAKSYSPAEELAHSLSHGLGALASIVALILMVRMALENNDLTQVLAVSVFGGSLILLYSASTLYHSVQSPDLKRRLKILDHAAIYLLIAGTYTPFALIAVQGTAGWALFATIWTLALTGVIFKLFFTGRFKFLSAGLYLAMGWCVVAFAKPVLATVSSEALWMLLVGGLSYTLGVAFYLWEGLRFHHAIWHVFVLGGSVAHVLAVLWYVLPHSQAG